MEKAENQVQIIAERFKDELKDSIIAISLHGSFAQGDFDRNSDIDYFMVLNEITLQLLIKIKILREKYEKEYGRKLSINILKETELPKTRKRAFYHKNRYALFLHEANKIDKVLIGNNPFFVESLPEKEEIQLEAVRIINSFSYFLRKFIVNSGLDYSVTEAIRYVIMATQYANAFLGEYPLKTSESINKFLINFDDFELKELPKILYAIKKGNKRPINRDKILDESIKFLESLDEYLFLRYSNL
jgi:predicted nucleotidyltransferase